MMVECNHNLVIHHESIRVVVENVDPEQYRRLEMLTEVYKAVFNEDSAIKNDVKPVVQMYCCFPGSNDRFEIEDDGDVERMFKLHQGVKVINVFVMKLLQISEDHPLIQFNDAAAQDENSGNDQQNVYNNEVVVEGGSLNNNEEQQQQSENENICRGEDAEEDDDVEAAK